MTAYSLPSWSHHRGRLQQGICIPGGRLMQSSILLHQPCLLWVPKVRRRQYRYDTPTFSGSRPRGQMNVAAKPVPFWRPHGGQRLKGLHNPCVHGVAIGERD